MMSAGFQIESAKEDRAAANIGMIFAAIYAVLILLVYYAQTTSVRSEDLSEQALKILDFKRGGLIFNYDLLGYGMMALSTFFIGLTVRETERRDKGLKCLMLIHGVFFVGCFILPMTGIFTDLSSGDTSNGGVIALVLWCAYFLPIGVLSFLHFDSEKQ